MVYRKNLLGRSLPVRLRPDRLKRRNRGLFFQPAGLLAQNACFNPTGFLYTYSPLCAGHCTGREGVRGLGLAGGCPVFLHPNPKKYRPAYQTRAWTLSHPIGFQDLPVRTGTGKKASDKRIFVNQILFLILPYNIM